MLAFPPVIASTRASVAETAVVGIVCFCLAVLSGLWNENFGDGDYFVRLLVVAAGAGVAVWIADLRVSLARERDAADLLAETGLLLQESWDTADRVEHVARLAVPDLADAATVDLCGRDGAILRSATVARDPEVEEGFKRMRALHPVDPDGEHPAAVAIRTGEMVMLDSMPAEALEKLGEDPEELELIRRTRPSSVMVVPLKARGTVLGALSMWILDPARRHDLRSQNVALRLAHRAALALDNARLHEQQAHIAQVLQGALRPRELPPISGFEAASRFLAAGGDAYEVGGDFYDAFDSGGGGLDGRDRRRLRQGPRGSRPDGARALRDPHGGHSRVRAQRGAADPGRVDRGRAPELSFCTAALARLEVGLERQRLGAPDGGARGPPPSPGPAPRRPGGRDRKARDPAGSPPLPRGGGRRSEPRSR